MKRFYTKNLAIALSPFRTNNVLYNGKNYTTYNKLPNPIMVAEKLSNRDDFNLKYDLVSKYWYQYNKGVWLRLNDEEAKQKLYFMLKEMPEIRNTFSKIYQQNVIDSLAMETGINFAQLSRHYKKQGLIPFKNGVLNLNTKELSNYDKNQYFSYQLGTDYNKDAKLDKEMIEFLIHICNYNPHSLAVLRYFMYLTLLRENKFQIAVYLWGQAGTGKSIFEQIMLALVGNKFAKTTTINELNSTHGTAKLMDAAFILFPDISSFKGNVEKFKNLVSGGLMEANPKYKNHIDFQPEATILLTSNLLWQPTDSSGGLQRRIIYITVDNKVKNINRDLFKYDYNSGISSGTLAKSLPGLINWILAINSEDLNFLNNDILYINSKTSPNMNYEVNPLLDWINNTLEYKENSYIGIGTAKSDRDKYLWPNYLEYCNERRFMPLGYNDFSNSLIQQMNIMYKKNIYKKRTASSIGIVHIGFKPKSNIVGFNIINYDVINKQGHDYIIDRFFKGFYD